MRVKEQILVVVERAPAINSRRLMYTQIPPIFCVHNKLQVHQFALNLYVGFYLTMHLKGVYSANGFCKSRPKTLRLQQRFYSWTSWNHEIHDDHAGQILLRFELTISNDNFLVTYGLEFK